MHHNEINSAMAEAMLKSFRKPQKGEQVWEPGFKGLFVSNDDYLNQPYLEGGYIRDDDVVEIWLKWEGFNFPDGSHRFHSNDVRNWLDAVSESKKYLAELA